MPSQKRGRTAFRSSSSTRLPSEPKKETKATLQKKVEVENTLNDHGPSRLQGYNARSRTTTNSGVYELRTQQSKAHLKEVSNSRNEQFKSASNRASKSRSKAPGVPMLTVSAPPSYSGSTKGHAPALLLIDADMWGKFHSQQNEMIITKAGRCLFPCLRLKAINLDPDAVYTVRLDLEKLESCRFRFSDSKWTPTKASGHDDDLSGENSTTILSKEFYTHPNLYQSGSHWMRNPISFAKAKLSNDVPTPTLRRQKGKKDDVSASSHIFHVMSFHRYRPRVHLIQWSQESNSVHSSTTYTYDRTSFIAVTHYQNRKVNDLKKDFNPHASGFRDTIGQSAPAPSKVPKKISRRRASSSQPKKSVTRPQKKPRAEVILNEVKGDNEGDSKCEGESGDHKDGSVNRSESDHDNDSRDDEKEEESESYDEASEEKQNAESDDSGQDSEGSDSVRGWSSPGRKVPNESDNEEDGEDTKINESLDKASDQVLAPQLCRLDRDNKGMVKISVPRRFGLESDVSEETAGYYSGRQPLVDGSAVFDSQVATVTYESSRQAFTETGHDSMQSLCAEVTTRTRESRVAFLQGFKSIPFSTEASSYDFSSTAPPPNTSVRDHWMCPSLDANEFSRLQELLASSLPTLTDPEVDGPGTTQTTPAGLLKIANRTPLMSAVPSTPGLVLDQVNLSSAAIYEAELEGSALTNPTLPALPIGLGVSTDGGVAPAPSTPPPTLSWYQQFFWDQASSSAPPAQTNLPVLSAPPPDSVGSALQLSLQLAMNESAEQDIMANRAPQAMEPRQYQHQQPTMALTPTRLFSGPLVDVESPFAQGNPVIDESPYAREQSGMSGLGTSMALGESACGSGGGEGGAVHAGGGHTDPRMLQATILESKTFMSTSSVISLSPYSAYSGQAHLERALRENLCLKSFIRERFGREAEADANAVVALQVHK